MLFIKLLSKLLSTLSLIVLVSASPGSNPSTASKALKVTKKVTGGIVGAAAGLALGAGKTVYHVGKAVTAGNLAGFKKHLGYGIEGPLETTFVGARIGYSSKLRSKLSENIDIFAPQVKTVIICIRI